MHFKNVCSCGEVISQCRCPDRNKTVRVIPNGCQKCSRADNVEDFRKRKDPIDIEVLSARLHDVYQKEAHRRGDVRHADAYEALPDATKEWDRVLARWIVEHWTPKFDAAEGIPPA